MKTLEEIKDIVGEKTFTIWERKAQRDLEASPYRFREAEAQHAYVYSEIQRRFSIYQNAFRVHEVSRR